MANTLCKGGGEKGKKKRRRKEKERKVWVERQIEHSVGLKYLMFCILAFSFIVPD